MCRRNSIAHVFRTEHVDVSAGLVFFDNAPSGGQLQMRWEGSVPRQITVAVPVHWNGGWTSHGGSIVHRIDVHGFGTTAAAVLLLLHGVFFSLLFPIFLFKKFCFFGGEALQSGRLFACFGVPISDKLLCEY
jgi:hypothetical protein